MSRNVQWYGWRPDAPDHRDLHYGAVLRAREELPIPDQMDLRSTMPEIQNQGAIGSCTAHAAVAVMEHNLIVQQRPFSLLSRLFAYYNARDMEGVAALDNGATLRDMVAALAKNGICGEDLWPYDTDQLAVKPSDAAYDAAKPNRIRLYARLNNLDDMLLCLAAGHPFIFGFTVYTGFESDEVGQSGVLNLPTVDEGAVGGHAVCAVGYDRTAERFIIRNSWGSDWGQSGYFTIPFAYLENRNLSDDFWTIRL
jgi:C1A family cysteine protease